MKAQVPVHNPGLRILIVSNQVAGANGVVNPVLQRMMASLSKDPRVASTDFAPFSKGNPLGTMRQIARAARSHNIIHVHFGGIYSLLVWLSVLAIRCPKIITFHGTDIHAKAIKSAKSSAEKLKIRLNQWASFLCILLYNRFGFVAEEMKSYVPRILKGRMRRKSFVHRLGVDYSIFTPLDRDASRRELGIGEWKAVLFSDISNSNVKRRDIAESIVAQLGSDYRLLVMSGVAADEVPKYISACDMLLLTSDEEGSPNIIRECLAMDKRVFSVEVGDARRQLAGLKNSMIVSRNPQEASSQILKSMQTEYTDSTREQLRPTLDIDNINKAIVDMYMDMLGKDKDKALQA